MAQFILGTNNSVICTTCHTNPVATVNGRQVSECAPCYARTINTLGMMFSDFTLLTAADNLERAIEESMQISVEEELARR